MGGKQWGSYGGGSSYGGGYRPSRPSYGSYGSYRPSRPTYGGYGRKKRDTESEALAPVQPEEIDSEGKQWGSYGGGSSYGGSYRPSRPSYGSYRPSRPTYGGYGGYGRKKRDTESEASLPARSEYPVFEQEDSYMDEGLFEEEKERSPRPDTICCVGGRCRKCTGGQYNSGGYGAFFPDPGYGR